MVALVEGQLIWFAVSRSKLLFIVPYAEWSSDSLLQANLCEVTPARDAVRGIRLYDLNALLATC